jgi:cell division protein FtsQ
VAFVGYGLATFALSSPSFVLKSTEDVVVEGNHFVGRDEVLGVLGFRLTGLHAPQGYGAQGGNPMVGTNVFRIPLEVMRREVENLPWVRTAVVTRLLPHGLLVHITERTPVAFASLGGHICLVDADGMLLEKPENGVFEFPIIYGLDSPAPSQTVRGLAGLEERRARLALYQEFMRQLGVEAPRAGWMISEVYLSDPEDLKALLILGQQTVQVHFGQKDFLPRFQNFLVLFPELQKSNSKLDSVDLRFQHQIVVAPQPVDRQAAETGVPSGSERKE